MTFLKEIKTEIGMIEKSKKRFRLFGLLVGLIFVFLTLFLIVLKGYNLVWLAVIGILLVIFGIFHSSLLYYPYLLWMGFATLMGFIISRILLIILFYLLIVPIGFFSRLFKGNFLNKKFDREVSSYWVKYKQKNQTKKELEQLY